MNMWKYLCGAALVVGAATAVQAQELKIGYVNSERVLREANPARAAQAKLEAEFGKREKDLAEQATRLELKQLEAAIRREYVKEGKIV